MAVNVIIKTRRWLEKYGRQTLNYAIMSCDILIQVVVESFFLSRMRITSSDEFDVVRKDGLCDLKNPRVDGTG